MFFPQIAIAIGVLTSNRGEGDEPFWQIGRGTGVPLQGGVDVVPLQGAIVVCHGWRGKVTTNFGGVDVVPLLGAIVRCHCSVLSLGRVTANFGGVDVVPLQGAIVVCYGWRGKVTTNFGGVDAVPLLGAIVRCHCMCYGWGWWRPTLAEWTWCHCREPF